MDDIIQILPSLSRSEKILCQKNESKKIACNCEALFLHMVLKEMAKTISPFKKSFAHHAFLDLFFEKGSYELAKKGIGIGRPILAYLEKVIPKEEPQSADKEIGRFKKQ